MESDLLKRSYLEFAKDVVLMMDTQKKWNDLGAPNRRHFENLNEQERRVYVMATNVINNLSQL